MGMIEGCGKGKCTGLCERSNTCPGYSDEEVKEAIQGLAEFLDWARAEHLVGQSSAWNEAAKLIWAAEQYLKAKPVIEWYADRENYERTWDESGDPGWINVVGDNGQRAREFLNGR